MSLIMVSLFLLARADDDLVTISLLRNAYEQHTTYCKSGRMKFMFKSLYHASNHLTVLQGVVEWTDDYMYFDGNLRQERASSKGRSEVDIDVKLLNSKGYELVRTSASERNPVPFVDYRIGSGRLNVSDDLRPDLDKYLVYSEAFGGSNSPLNLLQSSTAVFNGRTFERSVSKNESLVDVALSFPSQMTTLSFDLEKGGFCTMCRTTFQRDVPSFVEATREWVSLDGNRWFPSKSFSSFRTGSPTSEPVRTGELTIDFFEPLSGRTFTGRPTLSSFGPVPKGATVSERRTDGTFKEWTEGVSSVHDLEEQLKRHSSQIRSGSLMDSENSR